MDVSLKSIRPDSDDYGYMADLYLSSFPDAEQEKLENIMRVSGTDFGHLYVVLDGERRVGMLYLLTQRDLVYIYYLAVDPELRGMGYGSRILELVKEEHPGCRFALGCEAPDDSAPNNEERLARLAFYERNGFRDTGHRSEWKGVTYVHMLCGSHEGRFEIGRIFARHRRLSRRPPERTDANIEDP